MFKPFSLLILLFFASPRVKSSAFPTDTTAVLFGSELREDLAAF